MSVSMPIADSPRVPNPGISAFCAIAFLIIASSAQPAVAVVATRNWAGYADAVTPFGDAFSGVSGSWIVPTVAPTPAKASSGVWVGLDGFNSGTVEQVGILANFLANGKAQYAAFYELYPGTAVPINSVRISPGDSVSAQVLYAGYVNGNDTYTLSFVNNTTALSFSTTVATGVFPLARSSAEWIVEAPNLGDSYAELTDLTAVTFTDAFATLNGSTDGSISAFSYTGLNLVPFSGLGAIVSDLGPSGDTFTVTVMPEPSALGLLSLLGLAACRRNR